MSQRTLNIGSFAAVWDGDTSRVCDITGRRVTFYGLTWRWFAFGFSVFK